MINDEIKKEITRLYESGLGVYAISTRLMIPNKTVVNVINNYKKDLRNPNNIYKDYEKGYTIEQLCLKYHQNERSIRDILRKTRFRTNNLQTIYVACLKDFLEGMKESELFEKYFIKNKGHLNQIKSVYGDKLKDIVIDERKINDDKKSLKVFEKLELPKTENKNDGNFHLVHSKVGDYTIKTDYVEVIIRDGYKCSVLPKRQKREDFEKNFFGKVIIKVSIQDYSNYSTIIIQK